MIHSVVFRVFDSRDKVFSHVYTQPFQGLITIIREISMTSNKDSKWIIELIKDDKVFDTWKINSSHNYRAGSTVITVSCRTREVVVVLNQNIYKVINELAEKLNQDPDGFGYNLHFDSLEEEVLFKIKNIHFLEFRNEYFPHNLFSNLRKMFSNLDPRRKIEELVENLCGSVSSELKGKRMERVITFKDGKIIKF